MTEGEGGGEMGGEGGTRRLCRFPTDRLVWFQLQKIFSSSVSLFAVTFDLRPPHRCLFVMPLKLVLLLICNEPGGRSVTSP